MSFRVPFNDDYYFKRKNKILIYSIIYLFLFLLKTVEQHIRKQTYKRNKEPEVKNLIEINIKWERERNRNKEDI